MARSSGAGWRRSRQCCRAQLLYLLRCSVVVCLSNILPAEDAFQDDILVLIPLVKVGLVDVISLLEVHRSVELRGGSEGGFELGVIEVVHGGERGILQRRQ